MLVRMCVTTSTLTLRAMSTTAACPCICRAGSPNVLPITNRAPAGSRLGFLRRAPHLVPLEHTRRGGGTIPATVLVVHRKFPVLFMASAGDGAPRTPRTPRAQEQAAAAAAAHIQQVCMALATGVPTVWLACIQCTFSQH